jgi:hypothetical protein
MYPVFPLWTIPIEALLLDTITGKPLPIASSVVMPNVSVLDGKRKTSELAYARARSAPLREPR